MTTKLKLDLQQFLPYRITVLASRIATSFAKLHAHRFDISIPEWRVMATLGQHEVLSSREICDVSEMDKAKVSRAVIRLVALKLVSKQENPKDSRSQLLELTPQGRDIHDKIVPIAKQLEQELLDALTPSEKEVFDRVLAKLSDRVLSMPIDTDKKWPMSRTL